MTVSSGIYSGIVRHTRVKPRKLSLRHSCFWVALDLDRIGETARSHWLFSHNGFNILSFHDRDHGVDGPGDLRQHIDGLVARAGVWPAPERVVLFCMPRVLGYGFNPLSLYFCSGADGEIEAIVYEVHNTFGERHSYVALVGANSEPIRQSAEKTFYVSPFMDMDLAYTFKLHVEDKRLALSISASDTAGPVIFTSVHASGKPMTSGNLLATWLAHPLLTFKVVSAIHFHALRLWLKGVKLRLRPPPPANTSTVGRTGRSSS